MGQFSLSGLAEGSKLILVGDCFKYANGDWQVVCYFLDKENRAFEQAFPVDHLPALIPGTIYPGETTINKPNGYTGTIKLPKMTKWEKCRYSDMPSTIRRLGDYSNKIKDIVVYRFEQNGNVYWLPAIELARMMFFHSSEVTRAAFYQANTYQIAKAWQQDWEGKIELSSNIPVNYLNNLPFRKFLAWLLFDSGIEKSFCSIFRYLNTGAYECNGALRWAFDFQLPDLSSCEISWSGYTDGKKYGQKQQCYIREIRSLSGVEAPNLDVIYFSHPDDVLLLEKELEDKDDKVAPNEKKIAPKIIDPYNSPKSGNKRHLLKFSSSGLHFDCEIDLARSPRNIRALPKGEKPKLDENQTEEDTVGITEGSNHGKKPRADINNLEEPELLAAPEKIVFFQKLLDELGKNTGWSINSTTGNVPQKRCRSAHLVAGRPRKYCHAVVQRDETTVVQILEIELTAKESLSTLFFRSEEVGSKFEKLLDSLMSGVSDEDKKSKAMQWKRQSNAELTISRQYLDHPDTKIKNETDAMESWVARAKQKVDTL